MDATSGAATPTTIEPNTSLVLCETHGSTKPDSSPGSEPSVPPPIESGCTPIMEFTAADVFQHSPFGDILKSLKSLSLSGEPWLDYGQQGWTCLTSTPKTSTVWTTMQETTKNQHL